MDRNSQGHWEKQFKKFETSGLSKEEFCSNHKLDRNLFYRWLKNIRPDLKGRVRKGTVENSQSDFITLKEKSPEQIHIKLKSGVELSFSTATSPHWIANFLKEFSANA